MLVGPPGYLFANSVFFIRFFCFVENAVDVWVVRGRGDEGWEYVSFTEVEGKGREETKPISSYLLSSLGEGGDVLSTSHSMWAILAVTKLNLSFE